MPTYYTESHEWIAVEGDVATVGITKHAAEQLGDVVFVEVKEAGETLSKGGELGTVESVKAASEIYAPVSGEVIEANSAPQDEPAKLNEDPEGGAWLAKIRLSDPAELDGLMQEDAYKAMIGAA